MKDIKIIIYLVILVVGAAFAVQAGSGENTSGYAWSSPSVSPPDKVVDAPINPGATTQYKSGGLGIGGVFQGYSLGIFDGQLGINTQDFQTKVNVNGLVKISDTAAQLAGVIKYMSALDDFCGYTGTEWKSLTGDSTCVECTLVDAAWSAITWNSDCNGACGGGAGIETGTRICGAASCGGNPTCPTDSYGSGTSVTRTCTNTIACPPPLPCGDCVSGEEKCEVEWHDDESGIWSRDIIYYCLINATTGCGSWQIKELCDSSAPCTIGPSGYYCRFTGTGD